MPSRVLAPRSKRRIHYEQFPGCPAAEPRGRDAPPPTARIADRDYRVGPYDAYDGRLAARLGSDVHPRSRPREGATGFIAGATGVGSLIHRSHANRAGVELRRNRGATGTGVVFHRNRRGTGAGVVLRHNRRAIGRRRQCRGHRERGYCRNRRESFDSGLTHRNLAWWRLRRCRRVRRRRGITRRQESRSAQRRASHDQDSGSRRRPSRYSGPPRFNGAPATTVA